MSAAVTHPEDLPLGEVDLLDPTSYAEHGDIERIANDIVQKLLDKGDDATVEFVKNVSAPLPIAVIAWLLGVPIDRLHSNLVGGIKRLPIRYKLKAA